MAQFPYLEASMTSKSPEHHPSFQFIRQQAIDSLNLEVLEFEHKITGAQHIHLRSDSPENVFLVALRTVPKDSTGVAHILEHTALCGSKKYPVRDPFFMMTRRSLNTFMNAFTSSDWTAYPFASLNRKDFDNLMDVYLDAVFFSRLDPLDFAQEGHRMEFTEPDNPDSPLVYKGVVYNEMKGAMSSVPSQLWQTISKYLFPTSTYHFNSGGDPDCIPDLSYEQLKSFYRTHYHPSNAIFMTFGDIPAAQHQATFEDKVLQHFQKLNYHVSVSDEKRFYAPIRVQESYPYTDNDAQHRSHVVMGWLLGKSTNAEDTLKSQLLSSVLLDNSATPLMLALESSDLGNGPSPMCGLDDSQQELSFMCGLEGCEAKNADQIEALILQTLESVAEKGIPQEDIDSALHQLELHQREIGGDSYPYGLQLIMRALSTATHRGNPVQLLNIDDTLRRLRKEIQAPDFIQQLVKDLLLDNPHRVRLVLEPDAELNSRKEKAEAEKLATIQAQMSETQKKHIVQLAADLKARQEQVDDPGLLPKVTLDDVPKAETHVEPEVTQLAGMKLSRYAAGTNGLVYQQCIYNLPPLDNESLPLLPLYTSCLTELGAGEKTYLDMQRSQALVSGGINVYTSVRNQVDNLQKLNGYVTYSGKALNRNHSALCDLMHAILSHARFDEVTRIRELIAQIRAHREQGITGSGHALAMLAASAGISVNSQISHQLSGLAGIKALKTLDNAIKDDGKLEQLAEKLAAIHKQIAGGKPQFLLIGEEANLDTFTQQLNESFKSAGGDASETYNAAAEPKQIKQAWLCNSQVNFCAKAYPTIPAEHPDSAALVVLGGFLRNGFLHKAIREQGGAYGGGASHDISNGAFRFYSYRDPRMQETLSDFDRAVDWLLTEKHSPQALEEAILGTVSAIDKSESPAGRAKRLFHAELHGRTLEYRQTMRERILSTTVEDLKNVAQTYLQPDKANIAVVTDFTSKEKAAAMDLETLEI